MRNVQLSVYLHLDTATDSDGISIGDACWSLKEPFSSRSHDRAPLNFRSRK